MLSIQLRPPGLQKPVLPKVIGFTKGTNGAINTSLQSAPRTDSVQFRSTATLSTETTSATQGSLPINLYTRENPLSAQVVKNTVLNPTHPDPDTHEIVFKVGDKLCWEPGQCIKVISDKPNNDQTGPHEAAYSIASHYNDQTHELALFVKRLKQCGPDGKINYWGRCSNYLCDRKPGDMVQIYGPQNDTLVLPKRNNINVIAVCGGTGLAPIKAILPDRAHSQGSTLLFYGVKNEANYAYKNELEDIALNHHTNQHHATIKLFVGFSDKTNGPDHRSIDNPADSDQEAPGLRHLPDVNYRWGGYIQEFVNEQQNVVLHQLENPNTYFVFCGNKPMLKGITDTLEKACAETGRDWKTLYSRLLTEGRWRVEAA